MMKTNLVQPFAIILSIAFSFMLSIDSWAAESQQYQLANGLAVYIGVLPVGMTTQHQPGGSGGETHGGTPTWGQQYHVIVALFDNDSGTRVTDAKINAAVFNASLPGKRASGPKKQLEPMQVAGNTVYGNYFNLPAPAPYRIEVDIRRGDSSVATRAVFNYTHALVPVKPLKE